MTSDAEILRGLDGSNDSTFNKSTSVHGDSQPQPHQSVKLVQAHASSALHHQNTASF
jgi:hypothetical protein